MSQREFGDYDNCSVMAFLGLTEHILIEYPEDKKKLKLISENNNLIIDLIKLETHKSILTEWSDSNKRLSELYNFKKKLIV